MAKNTFEHLQNAVYILLVAILFGSDQSGDVKERTSH